MRFFEDKVFRKKTKITPYVRYFLRTCLRNNKNNVVSLLFCYETISGNPNVTAAADGGGGADGQKRAAV
jgi:hypothetical protein